MKNSFYTSIEKYGNDILWRGYENGKPFARKVKYEPTFYLPNRKGDSNKYSLGTEIPLAEKKFPNMKEAKEFVDQYKDVHGMRVYGNSNFIAQFTYDKYPDVIKYDMQKIHIFMFDIEVDISTGFPDMQKADKPITSIALKSSKRSEYVLLGLKDYDKHKTETGISPDNIRFHKFDDEIALLSYFIKIWKNDYPDIITGWNCIPVGQSVWGHDKIYKIENCPEILYASRKKNSSPISKKNKYAIKLANGKTIYSSGDHKFFVREVESEKYTKLSMGNKTNCSDAILTAKEMLTNEKVMFVPMPIRKNDNCDNINYSGKSLYLAGLVFADGSLKDKNNMNYGYTIYQKDKQFLMDLEVNPNISGNESKGHSVYVNPEHLGYASKLIYQDNKKKLNVEELSTLSERQFYLFLSGMLDGDGCRSGNLLSLCNFDGHIDEISELMQWNGIFNTVTKNHVRPVNLDFTKLSVRHKRFDNYSYDCIQRDSSQKSNLIRFKKIDDEYFVRVVSVEDTGDVVDMMDIETDNHSFVSMGVKVHNCEFFDIQYIITRISRIFGENVAKSLSPWGYLRPVVKEMYGKEQYTYHIYGISILDYMDAFKKFGYKYGTQESYKLDHIGHVVLGERKLSYEEYGNLTTLYEQNPQKYLDYNLKDTHLIQRFEEETALLALVITVAYDGGCNYKDAFGTVGIWDTILYRRLMNDNQVPPVKGGPGERSNDLVGGFVKEPKPGMYKWIVSFDLNSLYPHLMLQYNMSPETIIEGGSLMNIVQEIRSNLNNPEHAEYAEQVREFVESGGYMEIYSNIGEKMLNSPIGDDNVELFHKANKMHNYIVSANGALFRKDSQGIIPQIIDEKYAERKAVKNEMLSVESEIEEIKAEMKKRGSVDKYVTLTDKEISQLYTEKKKEVVQLHNKQMSVKILMNSLYGATANVYFIYYIMEMAEAITKSGQLSVQWSARYVNAYLNKILKTDEVDYVVYIDTDSIYINMEPLIETVFGTSDIDKDVGEKFLDNVCKDKIEKVIDKSYDDLYNILGAYKNAMKMKREKINDRALFVSKKRYLLNTLNSEGVHYDTPKVSITGLEAVRSSTPEVCRNKLKNSFKIIMNSDEAETQKFIDEFYKEFVVMPADKIGKNSGTDNIEKYINGNSYAKGCPAHVRGAICYNNLLKAKGLDKKYDLIQSGDKVKTVYLKMPNPLRENLISFPEMLPKELGLDSYIDYDTQFEKVFLSPVEGLLQVIGWKSKQKDTILDLFE